MTLPSLSFSLSPSPCRLSIYGLRSLLLHFPTVFSRVFHDRDVTDQTVLKGKKRKWLPTERVDFFPAKISPKLKSFLVHTKARRRLTTLKLQFSSSRELKEEKKRDKKSESCKKKKKKMNVDTLCLTLQQKIICNKI